MPFFLLETRGPTVKATRAVHSSRRPKSVHTEYRATISSARINNSTSTFPTRDISIASQIERSFAPSIAPLRSWKNSWTVLDRRHYVSLLRKGAHSLIPHPGRGPGRPTEQKRSVAPAPIHPILHACTSSYALRTSFAEPARAIAHSSAVQQRNHSP